MEILKLSSTDNFFIKLKDRPKTGAYFIALSGINNNISDFLLKYFNEAKSNGTIINDGIKSPDENNLAYYNEIIGSDFIFNIQFIKEKMKKWLPRVNQDKLMLISELVFDTLNVLKNQGKNDNIIKNTYIKFMCWLYYRFESTVSNAGKDNVPKILYEGRLSKHEFMILDILCHAGCDVVVIVKNADILKEPMFKGIQIYNDNGLEKFPDDFSLEALAKKNNVSRNTALNNEKQNNTFICTNAWCKGDWKYDIMTPYDRRTVNGKKDERFFYNCFFQVFGAEDPADYLNEIYQLNMKMKSEGRQTVIIENKFPVPTVDEINQIKRTNYSNSEQLIGHMSANLKSLIRPELFNVVNSAFVELLTQVSAKYKLSQLITKSVYLLCYIKRYSTAFFQDINKNNACLIFWNAPTSDNDVLTLKFFSRVPVDVLVLIPDLSRTSALNDKYLIEIKNEQSVACDKFPTEITRAGTVAYHAERELDTILYSDSGMYRDYQYGKMNTITLQTTFEEISILWDQELKYRPDFSVFEDKVNVPVIFAKVSGVKEKPVIKYWRMIKALITDDTLVVKNTPYIKPGEFNQSANAVVKFYKNFKLQKKAIKEHPNYPYGFLNADIQELILDKLEKLIESEIIKGTRVKGVEYLTIAVVMNMNRDIVRLIQKFDFTKKNPKLIYISTTESICSQEDAILLAFLNLIGFDIVIFTPTGYSSAEQFYNKKIIEEYMIGEYMYDMNVPDFNSITLENRTSFIDRFFKKG